MSATVAVLNDHSLPKALDVGDVAGLKEAMESLSKNKPLVSAMGARVRKYATGDLAYALFSMRLAPHLQVAAT